MPPNVPLLTIITVHLSQFDQLQSTLDSLRTTLADDRTEWIVIDGGSDWAEHSALHDEIRALAATFISEPDAGTYDAMNKGTAYAQGQHVLFMNAGDLLLLDNIVDILAATEEQYSPDIIFFHSTEGHSPEKARKKRSRSVSAIWYGMPTHHQAIIFKTAVCRHYPYDIQFRLAADYKVLCQAFQHKLRIIQLDHVLCFFDRNGISSQQFYQGLREEEIIRQTVLKTLPAKNISIRWLRCVVRALRHLTPQLYQLVRYDISA